MEKSYEDRCKEMRAFKALSAEDQKTELGKLEEKVKTLCGEITSNSKGVEETQGKLELAKSRLESIRKETSEIREKRQRAISFGKDPKEITVRMKELKGEEELLEDTCIGFSLKLEDLTAEKELLEAEKLETEKAGLRLRLVPLVSEWNKQAAKLPRILEQIVALEWDLGASFGYPSSGNNTVLVSDREGLEQIPKLYLLGDDDNPEDRMGSGCLKDIFNYRAFIEEFRAKRNKAAISA